MQTHGEGFFAWLSEGALSVTGFQKLGGIVAQAVAALPGCGLEEDGPHEGVCQRGQVMGLSCQV